MTRPKGHLSAGEARRIALAAQGFGARKTAGQSAWPRVASAIGAMRLLQLDSVNVLVRSHYLPVFSRIGAYDRAGLDRRAFRNHASRGYFEYWAHEASLLPLDLHPLMRWRMEQAKRLTGFNPGYVKRIRDDRPYLTKVLREVTERGPIAASDLTDPGQKSGPWWGWHRGKEAIEYLFRTGDVTTAGRRGAFERVYDLTERVIPAAVLSVPTPPENDAIRALAHAGASAFGVATEFDIRDYFRLPVAGARAAIAELVDDGQLTPVTVEGWDRPAYLAAGAATPGRVAATALLSPFDPLVWFRPRTERLFDFHYRIEIYTPQAKRKFGYYVLPFLMNGRLVGRVDLKADRAAGVLDVRGIHAEARTDHGAVAAALAPELRRLAAWLGLGSIRVHLSGNLAGALAPHF